MDTITQERRHTPTLPLTHQDKERILENQIFNIQKDLAKCGMDFERRDALMAQLREATAALGNLYRSKEHKRKGAS